MSTLLAAPSVPARVQDTRLHLLLRSTLNIGRTLNNGRVPRT
jgi:hypothetical protein